MAMASPPLDLVVPTTNAKKRKLETRGEPRKPKFMKKILDDDKATKTTSFNKRMPTLLTKSFQLETLCDVSVCVLCYSSNGKVETWPKDRAEAEARVLRYKEVADKEKRESNVVALLEGTKRSLIKKVAKEVSACFSDLANDKERLDTELKRIEDKIRVLTSNGDQWNMDVASTTIPDDEFICLDDLVGPNFSFDPLLLGGGDSDGIGFGDLGFVENECPNGSELAKLETSVSNLEDDVFLSLPDIIMVQNGVDSRKVENFGNLIIQDNNTNINCAVEVDNYDCLGNGTSCSFEDDFYPGLDGMVGPNCNDSVKGNGFINPVQECSNNSPLMVDNSFTEAGTSYCTFDDDFFPYHTIVGPDPNCYNSMKIDGFGNLIQVTTNNSLPVSDNSSVKSSTGCYSFVDNGIYLDDIVGWNFTFGGPTGIDPSLFGGDSAGIGFGGMEFGGFCFPGFC